MYAPLVQPRDASRDPYQPLPRDGPGVVAWRVRMGTEEAKAILLWQALAQNLMRSFALGVPIRAPVRA